MSARDEFLREIFRRLEADGVAYCVLRNFDEVFADTASDVDLLASTRDAAAVQAVCDAAAAAHGWRLVQVARFVNHSRCYERDGRFVRIDVDTAVRWRWCHGLSAGEVLHERVRGADFFTPSPRHEAFVLRTQVAWLGRVTERYAQRLAVLGETVPNPRDVRRTFLLRTLMNPTHWLRAAFYATGDLVRFVQRLARPPGVALQCFVAGHCDLDPLIAALDGLLPRAKHSITHAPRPRFDTLYKGGLAVALHDMTTDAALNARRRESAFVCRVDPSSRILAAHGRSGAMAECADMREVARFIVDTLARAHARRPASRGACVLLAGLDGAGKTTFARQLCIDVARGGRFAGVRYFHWIPSAFGPQFPWPASGDLPRNTELPRGWAARLLSGLRLARNVLRARLAFAFRVRPLLARGFLVILDRFVMNYWLDPASVRYSGPERWLAWALPWLPPADVLFALGADAATLLARKGELTPEQIAAQSARLRALPAVARCRIDLDATQSPEALAQYAMQRLEQIPP